MYPRPGKIRDRWWGRVDCRGKLSSGLVRPMPVIMDDVLAQGGEEMSFAVNEAVVQTLPARGANPAFRERVGPSRPRWRANDPHAFRGEDHVERPNELRIPIPDQERELGGPVAQTSVSTSRRWPPLRLPGSGRDEERDVDVLRGGAVALLVAQHWHVLDGQLRTDKFVTHQVAPPLVFECGVH